MNPVLLLVHNNVHLVKRCVESLRAQDVMSSIFFVDNGSDSDTVYWLAQHPYEYSGTFWPENRGVSAGWNHGINALFSDINRDRADHCLVVGTDTVLAPWCYRHLLSLNLPFVTGVAVDQMSQLIEPNGGPMELQPHPDFSCFLIRRDCWEKVGPFDERMKLYASDCDFHVRAHRLGVPLYKACVPYYHERSSTLRLASPEERLEIETQANKDRATFRSIYGCVPGDFAYEAMFLTPVL